VDAGHASIVSACAGSVMRGLLQPLPCYYLDGPLTEEVLRTAGIRQFTPRCGARAIFGQAHGFTVSTALGTSGGRFENDGAKNSSAHQLRAQFMVHQLKKMTSTRGIPAALLAPGSVFETGVRS
jgi:hypothetical protein